MGGGDKGRGEEEQQQQELIDNYLHDFPLFFCLPMFCQNLFVVEDFSLLFLNWRKNTTNSEQRSTSVRLDFHTGT